MYDSAEKQTEQLKSQVFEVLELCEAAIHKGALPDTTGWERVQPIVPGFRSSDQYYRPQDMDVVVQSTEASFGNGTQLSCRLHLGPQFKPLSDDVVAEVFLALMQERGKRLASGDYIELPISQLGQGTILEGFRSKEVLREGCPLGVVFHISRQDPFLGLSLTVSDRFTWCS